MSKSDESKDSVVGEESTDNLMMSEKLRQRSSNEHPQINGGDKLASPKSPIKETDTMYGEEEVKYETLSGSVTEEPVNKKEQDTTRPSVRANASSFAAPTKASEAKKNEKIELPPFFKKVYSTNELPVRPGSATRQHSVSILDNRQPSLQRRSVTMSMHIEENDDAVDHSLHTKKRRRTSSESLSSAVSDKSAEEEGRGHEEEPHVLENEVPEEQAQRKGSQGEEEPLAHNEKGLGEVEEILTKKVPLECRVADFRPEVEDMSQVARPQDQIKALSPCVAREDQAGSVEISTDTPNIVSEKIIIAKEKLEVGLRKAEKERDEAIRQRETAQQDLKTVKDDAEKLKHQYDKLVIQLRESEDKIEARNVREPDLPALEVIEAENKELRVAIDETRLVLKKKEKELNDAIAYCADLDDERREAEEKLKNQEASLKTLCEIIDQVSQAISQGLNVDVTKLDELSQSLTQAAEIGRLRVKVVQLIGTFGVNSNKSQDRNEKLERKIAHQGSEIVRLEKAMEFQITELRSPSLQSPMLLPAVQMDRNEFEQHYKRERMKRKDAEQKLAEAKELLAHLHSEKEKLQSDLTRAQRELADLQPKADKLERDARGWKEDSAEKKSQLEERTHAFEANTAQQMQETHRYIKDYYNKTKDEAYWDVQGLQKKLDASEEERVALKRAFEQAKVRNAYLEAGITRLRKRNETRDVHFEKIEQAFIRGAGFPSLEPDNDTPSPTSTSTISPLAHPFDLTRKPLPPIPRCHLPTAIEARNARITIYHEELEKAREQELFNVSVKPSVSVKNNKGLGHDEIMEKVRKWKMEESYPPTKPGWEVLRRRGAWERWDGDVWARELAQGKDVDVLRKRGLWDETWV